MPPFRYNFAYNPLRKFLQTRAIKGGVFFDVPFQQATLYVPEASLESYKTTSPWSNFGTILPITSTGIENTSAIKSNTIDAVYDLDGKTKTMCPTL